MRLNLSTLPAVQSAANAILSRARQLRPDARTDGLLVQPTIVRPKARELIVGIADDATFGPVIVVGRGGTAVEVINDKALALPPLDLRLAHELIGQTRASRILKAYGDVPAADERALALALVKPSTRAGVCASRARSRPAASSRTFSSWAVKPQTKRSATSKPGPT